MLAKRRVVAVGQPVGVEMVFRHIDAKVSLVVFSAPLLVIRGSPGVSVRAKGKDEGDQTLARPVDGRRAADPTLAADEGHHPLSGVLLAFSARKVIRQAVLQRDGSPFDRSRADDADADCWLLIGIRSERRLCDEVHLNLAYRWFCRLGLDGDVPDHSTFSKNRHGRFRESDLLRKLFETVVARCIKERIVGGEAFAVDASIIVADAHRRRSVAKVEDLVPTSSRAVAEYLSALDDAAFSGATPVEPKLISPTDPAARYTASANSVAGYP